MISDLEMNDKNGMSIEKHNTKMPCHNNFHLFHMPDYMTACWVYERCFCLPASLKPIYIKCDTYHQNVVESIGYNQFVRHQARM